MNVADIDLLLGLLGLARGGLGLLLVGTVLFLQARGDVPEEVLDVQTGLSRYLDISHIIILCELFRLCLLHFTASHVCFIADEEDQGFISAGFLHEVDPLGQVFVRGSTCIADYFAAMSYTIMQASESLM